MNFKVGDWGYHEFELVQVTEIDDNWVIVTTGRIESCGNINLYPLSIGSKLTSEYVSYYKEELRKVGRNLNWPDIHRKYVSMWKDIVEETDDKRREELHYDVRNFTSRCIESLNDASVDNVKIFR